MSIHIDHVALWVRDLERARTFYCRYFDRGAEPRYHDERKGFTSYFLGDGGGGARPELLLRGDGYVVAG